MCSENEQVEVERSKHKEEDRKYGCPCGKYYLSYPALFTHVKQKHEGKPPGKLIKPQTGSRRGRPRLPHINTQEENSISNYDVQEQIQKALLNRKLDYSEPFEPSRGNESCHDMASEFLTGLKLEKDQRTFLNCFLNYLRFFVNQKYDADYWESVRPTEIIDISNQIVHELDANAKLFPIPKEVLIDLLFILFRWMYKNKWTDHKLAKRATEVESPKRLKEDKEDKENN